MPLHGDLNIDGTGNGLAQTLSVGGGDDRIEGGAGADTLDRGDGLATFALTAARGTALDVPITDFGGRGRIAVDDRSLGLDDVLLI